MIRTRVNNMHAKLFDDALSQLLRRYELNQLTSAEVVQELVQLVQKMREARRRHEALGLSVEEAAFYDAVAGASKFHLSPANRSGVAYSPTWGAPRNPES